MTEPTSAPESAASTGPASGAGFVRPGADHSFATTEERILERWAAERTFHRSVEQRRAQGAEPFVFYDGPPFANGHPHYGHILTSYVKDTVPRYFTMRGRLVERRWGWDCHGLPVELDAQHQLSLGGVKEINDFGVGAFNETCRNSVFTYASEWERVVDRIGRWVDWDDQYRTMDLDYMESVLHIFHTLYAKGLIYESFKVLAYCTSCQTPLSNFETRLDDAYRDRTDPTVTVRLPFVDDPSTSILVWTTTPWTLPSNVLAAVSPTMTYETWQAPDGASRVVLAAASVPAYAEALDGWTKLSEGPGTDWVGKAYVPIFDDFADTPNAFRVVAADFVTEGDGTGVVHIAPAFGEDDARLGRAADVVGPMPVRDDGTFDERVTVAAGLHVFDANPVIEQAIAAAGRLFAAKPYVHAYPHCWRCDSALIYRAIDSWMVAIEKLRDQIQAANATVNWIPDHVGPGAMGHGISSAPDWALTRNRFWGSPVPVWKCDRGGAAATPAQDADGVEHVVGGADPDCTARYVPSSIADLEATSGATVTDLHRPAIDAVTWACTCGGTMRRVPDVLDCWFESGSMPFAQRHWMGEPITELDFPADFIVEYIGQVRGWFYTLLVISTALTGGAPFANCLAHGILLGDDGRKLSKRLKNYPDPEAVIGTFGSDALRASLLASPIVRGGDGAIAIDGVREAQRAYQAPLLNAYTFFATYAAAAGYDTAPAAVASPEVLAPSHPLDRYALAAVELLRAEVTAALDAYDLSRAYDALGRFCESLTNWYIRLSRRRFWTPTAPMSDAEREPFDVLCTVLWRTARIAAPLLPFTAEWLAGMLGADDSVHLDDWPEPVPAWSDDALVSENDLVAKVVTMARSVRADAKRGNRQPLARLLVVGLDAGVAERFADVIRSEVNVKQVEVRADAGELATSRIVPNPRVLGPRLGQKVQDVIKAARAGDVELRDDGSAVVAGEVLQGEEFSVSLEPASSEIGVTADRGLVVGLDLQLTPELEREGQARQVLRRVQDLRKRAGLEVSDRIELRLGGAAADAIATAHGEFLAAETLAVSVTVTDDAFADVDGFELAGAAFSVSLRRV